MRVPFQWAAGKKEEEENVSANAGRKLLTGRRERRRRLLLIRMTDQPSLPFKRSDGEKGMKDLIFI